MMKAVFVNRSKEYVHYVYGPEQLKRLHTLTDIDENKVYQSVEALRAQDLSDVEAIFSAWAMLPLTEEEIREIFPSLKAVFYAGGSARSFAGPFVNSGVKVFSGWHANGKSVAEFTYAQILLASKGFFTVQNTMRASGRMAAHQLFKQYPGAYGIKVGLLGCGAIGAQVAEMLKSTDCEVWAYDPFMSEEKAKALNVKIRSLDEIFSECLIVSNHLANLPETAGIIRREHLLSMLPLSTFINTGRGPQLDEKDLYDALTQDPSRTALLDVVTDEGNSDASPLAALPNCFLTPHMAGASGQEPRRMADYVLDAFCDWQAGKKNQCEIIKDMLVSLA